MWSIQTPAYWSMQPGGDRQLGPCNTVGLIVGKVLRSALNEVGMHALLKRLSNL